MSLVESDKSKFQLSLSSQNETSHSSFLPDANIELIGHKAGVNTVQFSPSGDLLASGGRDRDLFIWSLSTEGVS